MELRGKTWQLTLRTGRVPRRSGRRVAPWPFWVRLEHWLLVDASEEDKEILQSNLQQLTAEPDDTSLRFTTANNYRMMARFDEARAMYTQVAESGAAYWADLAQQLLDSYPGDVWEHDATPHLTLRPERSWTLGPWQVQLPERKKMKEKKVMKLIDAWQQIILGDTKSWVLFEEGTCVILMKPDDDLAAQAIEILKEWGPVYPGSPAGDFSVISLSEEPGWVVTGHHRDVLNYVGIGDVTAGASDVEIGMWGRSRRHADSQALHVVHVEDKRVVPSASNVAHRA